MPTPSYELCRCGHRFDHHEHSALSTACTLCRPKTHCPRYRRDWSQWLRSGLRPRERQN